MELLIITCLSFGIWMVWANRDWIKYMWSEHVLDTFPKNLPAFCHDCNLPSCANCPAYEAYLDDPDAGWRVFLDMKYNKKPLDI